MSTNPLQQLETVGQSLWLDYISRDLISSGKLKRLIEDDGLRGMTSNPAIFEKSIVDSHDYDADIKSQASQGKEAFGIYDALSQKDVRSAADEFAALYARTDGADGYVSLEVNPHLARDTQGTIAEARRLWAELERPNVMIKVPATKEGLPAIRQLISEGISVNVTLVFGLQRYRDVAEAYIAGLEALDARKIPLKHVASVASFFVSRIDSLVDPLIEQAAKNGPRGAELAKEAGGRTAIASAKLAYQIYKELFSTDRFRRLSNHGARVQRLLWASTSTKNPKDSDVKYVEALIGKETVDTAPLDTVNAYRDHGKPAARLESGLAEAKDVFKGLAELGIDIDQATQKLEDEGVDKFNQPFDKLIAAIAQRSKAS
jgi:transaldolase